MGLDLMTYSFLGLRDKLHHIALRYLQCDDDAHKGHPLLVAERQGFFLRFATKAT